MCNKLKCSFYNKRFSKSITSKDGGRGERDLLVSNFKFDGLFFVGKGYAASFNDGAFGY